MAVSPLIMVRYENIQNLVYSGLWSHSDENENDVAMTSRDDVIHTSDVMHDVIKATVSFLPLVVKQLLGGTYLWNRLVDFVHFWQANSYGTADLILKKLAPSDKYPSCDRIFRFPWQPIKNFKFRFRELFSVTFPDVCAKFGAHRSINGRGDSGQTESVTLLKL